MTDRREHDQGMGSHGFPPAGSGFLRDGWFTEEFAGSCRLSLNVGAMLHEEVTPYQKIAVFDTAFFGRVLALDGLIMVTERDEFVYHEMITHIPLCAIPSPHSVLVVGGGDCGVVREVLKHETIQRVVQCEIDRRVTEISERYFDWVREARTDPRLELVFDDGVKYIEANRESFDLIVIDSTDPIGPAVGLFLEDFYRKVAAALRPGGAMTAQVESCHWSSRVVGSIFKNLRPAFQHVDAYWGAIPTYPSGSWTWAFASQTRHPKGPLDEAYARKIAQTCSYYDERVHKGAFALPRFMQRAIAGDDPFARFATAVSPES